MIKTVTIRKALTQLNDLRVDLLLATLVVVGLVGTGLPGAVMAQTTYVDEDGTVGVSADGAVDCDGTGTTAEPSVNSAVGAGAADIDVCAGTYSGESFTISAGTDIRPVRESATVTLTSSKVGAAPFVIGASDVTIQDISIRHTGTNGEGVSTVDITSGMNVNLVDLSISRSDLDDTFRTINLGGNQTVRIEGCRLTGGAIGDGAETGNYEIIGNTIEGAGDEAIWVYPKGGEITIRDNVIETTADGDAQDDRRGVAIYGATSLLLENNQINATTAPLLLGNDIPILHNGSTAPLQTVSDMQAVLGRNTLNGASPGTATFLAQVDGSTLLDTDGNHVVRTGITSNPGGGGGSSSYGNSALDAVSDGGVIYLTDGSSYAESITVTGSPSGPTEVDKNVGFGVSSTASIQGLTVDGAYTVSLPSGEVTVTGSLTLGDGSTLEGEPIVLGDGVSFTDNGLSSGSIAVTRTVNGGQTRSFGGIGLTLADNGGGTPPGEVTITRTDGKPVTIGEGSISRYYDVTADTETGLDVDLTFGYDSSELDGRDPSGLALFQSDDAGRTWAQITTDAVDANANTLTTTALSSFSRFTAATDGAKLPVELTSFSARTDGQGVVLEWRTASETNNAGFQVQRRREAGFETIHFEPGQGTVTRSTTYRHRVADLGYGTHTFRLQQVDRDGSTTVSEAVQVDFRIRGAFELSKVSPNPVSNRGQLDLVVEQSQDVTVDLYDALGRHVTTLQNGRLSAGTTHQFVVSPQGLSNGTYFLRVRGTRFEATRRLVVVK